MPGLALLLLTLTPITVAVPAEPGFEAPCAVAEEIAMQRPCLKPEDCGAFQEWRRMFGPPGPRPLPGQPAARRAAAAPTFVCPAAPGR